MPEIPEKKTDPNFTQNSISRILGPGIFREFEIRVLIIHNFPSNSM